LAIDYSSNGNGRINLTLDGNDLPHLDLPAQPMTTRLSLVSGLPDGKHTIWLEKGNEPFNGAGVVNVTGFYLDPNAVFYAPPAPKSRRIETIGDSSFSSYGVLGSPPGCNAIDLENADYAIPALTAKLVDAEIINLSATGEGVVESQWDSSTDPNHHLPYIYHHWIGHQYSPLWDFHVPMDVVLVSGGGDDIIGDSGNGAFSNPNVFITTYANMLLDIRSHYSKASIYAIMSPNAKWNDRTTMMNALKAAVAQAQASQPGGDPNILFFDYFANDPNGWTSYDDVANTGGYGWGCAYHTSMTGSQWLADRLAANIKSHMVW
jgi:hypothetical protein